MRRLPRRRGHLLCRRGPQRQRRGGDLRWLTQPARAGPLAGRVALVTGAAQGMGAAHARRLARDGAVVAVNDLHDSAGPARPRRRDRRPHRARRRERPRDRCAHWCSARGGRPAGSLDVLVANHAYMTMAPFLEHDPDDWWKVVDTNLGGTFHLVQAVLPHMRAKGSRAHRRRHERVGDHRLARRHGIRRVEGRADLARQDPGPRAGPRGDHRQRGRAGRHRHPAARGRRARRGDHPRGDAPAVRRGHPARAHRHR